MTTPDRACNVPPPSRTATIEERARFDFVRYANCWEDAELLIEALAPTRADRILSIASAGDNAFALAGAGAEVVAVDLNPSQLALCELKRAAIRRFDYHDVLGFLGLRPSSHRLTRFRQLRSDLDSVTRQFWDQRHSAIAAGVVHDGKFERYFALFRNRVLPLIHRRATVLALLERRSRSERIAFYRDRWSNRRWRLVFRAFFSRTAMGRLGRDPEFFRYVDGPVAPRILARVEHALTELPTHDNPYLEYILTGNFERALPPYLVEDRFEAVRAGMDRVTLWQGSIGDATTDLGGTFSGFNLSDIFEYLDPELSAALYGQLVASARPSARLAYWNMLVPRSAPAGLGHRVRRLRELDGDLHARDRAFFYSDFVVEEVLPSPPMP